MNGIGVLVSFVSPRSRIESRSNGVTSLHSISTLRLSLHTRPTTSSLLLKEVLSKGRNGESPHHAASDQRPIVYRFVRIHFLSLLDGSPYCASPSNITICVGLENWRLGEAAGARLTTPHSLHLRCSTFRPWAGVHRFTSLPRPSSSMNFER